ncbi:hypothetical protein I7I51_06156 [Histoplasma capsulatum]|uniref:Uncharacterized protein n=1 Tax=Ajellomyces capsulatus TaxID=5037 RepID=A0A8A1MKY6_AJECA|nr:hypothetical protein I7I51_06156 [Histoplasma capsulatum]
MKLVGGNGLQEFGRNTMMTVPRCTQRIVGIEDWQNRVFSRPGATIKLEMGLQDNEQSATSVLDLADKENSYRRWLQTINQFGCLTVFIEVINQRMSVLFRGVG